jgi:hypothetical protein
MPLAKTHLAARHSFEAAHLTVIHARENAGLQPILD